MHGKSEGKRDFEAAEARDGRAVHGWSGGFGFKQADVEDVEVQIRRLSRQQDMAEQAVFDAWPVDGKPPYWATQREQVEVDDPSADALERGPRPVLGLQRRVHVVVIDHCPSCLREVG